MVFLEDAFAEDEGVEVEAAVVVVVAVEAKEVHGVASDVELPTHVPGPGSHCR